MSSVQEIEKAIQGLPREEIQSLHDWIANYLEDELEMTSEFQDSIERGKHGIAEGKSRVRKP
jgi:cell division septum initiation protein DivIVA